MILIPQKLDYSPANRQDGVVRLFTGNAYVNKYGALVMGRGAALEVKTHYPEISIKLGELISVYSKPEGYGIWFVQADSGDWFGVFQVKQHYRDKADLNLIDLSVAMLKLTALNSPETRYHMNYPGIGYGGLTVEAVAPLIERLPNNVVIYRG